MVLALMPRDRFFVDGVYSAGEQVALAPDDARKLVTVLRARSGERVRIVDAVGAVFDATLIVDGRVVHAVLQTPLPGDIAPGGQLESQARIVVAQAIPKGQKMDLIVEKATELGVTAIVPVRSARVAGEQTGEHKRERWQRIAKSAAAQCGRTRVPLVDSIVGWPELLGSFAGFERVYLLWEASEPAPLRDRFEREVAAASSFLIVVGPEGGFAPAEVDAARTAGAVPISLGRRILRTETAALVVLSALLYARGEL